MDLRSCTRSSRSSREAGVLGETAWSPPPHREALDIAIVLLRPDTTANLRPAAMFLVRHPGGHLRDLRPVSFQVPQKPCHYSVRLYPRSDATLVHAESAACCYARLAFRIAARMRPERPAAAISQSLHAGLAFDPAAALIKLEQVHDGLEEVICGGALTMAPQ